MAGRDKGELFHWIYILCSEVRKCKKLKKLFTLLTELQEMHGLIVGDMMHGLGLRHVLFTMFCCEWDLMSHSPNASLC